MKIEIETFCIIITVITVSGDGLYSDKDDTDAIINYLLNGGSMEIEVTNEIDDESEPVLNGGIWKCGNCDNIDEQKLIYNEVNEVAAEMVDDQSVEIQVAVAMNNMKCVTILCSIPGVVKRMAGACRGPSVTLTVLPAHQFTLMVYGD